MPDLCTGFKLYKQKGKHQTALYDEDTLQNPEKLNYIVRQMLLPELYDYQNNNVISPPPLPAYVSKRASIVDLTDCFDYWRIEFEKVINLSAKRSFIGAPLNEHASALTSLSNLCEIKSDKIAPEDLAEETRYLGLEHIESNMGRLLNENNTSSIDLQSTKNVFKKGDVLYGKLHPYLNKVYLAEFDGVCSTDILVLKSQYPKLLKYVLVDKDFVAQTLDLMKGISLPRLQIKDFLNLKVYFPKTKEAIEKTVREIEAIEITEQANREQIEKARRSITELIQNSRGKKYPIRLIAEINPAKSEIQLGDDELVSFVDMPSVSDEGFILNKVDKPLREVSQGYTYFRDNDVLFAKITPCMENGKGALAKNLTSSIGFGSTEFFVLRANGKILPELLFRYTQDKEFRKQAEASRTGASGHKRVPKSFLENYEIPVPSIGEQKGIVVEIRLLEKQIMEAKERLSKAAERKAEILRKYL